MRTLAEHHNHAGILVRHAMAVFDAGSQVVALPIARGEQLVLEWTVELSIPEEEGPRLCLYWMTYLTVDRMLRKRFPVLDER